MQDEMNRIQNDQLQLVAPRAFRHCNIERLNLIDYVESQLVEHLYHISGPVPAQMH